MPIPDRFNPRIWLRNIIVRVNRWLWKLTPAERAELARMWKEAEEVSRMASGKRPIPHKLVGPLCAATGSNLLRQYRDLQAALNEVYEVTRLADLLRAA